MAFATTLLQHCTPPRICNGAAAAEHLHQLLAEELSAIYNITTMFLAPQISPVLSLPSDITCQIFELVVDPESRGLISVTHVCRVWRDLALQTPLLWTD